MATDVVPGYEWVIPVVFAVFLVISLIYELISHRLEHWLEHRGSRSLLAILHGLKNELLLYGLLSLIVSLVEPRMRTCVTPKGGKTAAYPPKDQSKDVHKCPEGQQEVLNYKLLYDLHVLIFMVAVSHIAVTLITLIACLVKVRTWKKWEPRTIVVDQAAGHHNDTHSVQVRPGFLGFCYHCWHGLSRGSYLEIRSHLLHLLADKMQPGSVPEQHPGLSAFPFYSLLKFSAERQLQRLASLEWFIWAPALVIVSVPQDYKKPALYVMVGCSGLALLICVAWTQMRAWSFSVDLSRSSRKRAGALEMAPAPVRGAGKQQVAEGQQEGGGLGGAAGVTSSRSCGADGLGHKLSGGTRTNSWTTILLGAAAVASDTHTSTDQGRTRTHDGEAVGACPDVPLLVGGRNLKAVSSSPFTTPPRAAQAAEAQHSQQQQRQQGRSVGSGWGPMYFKEPTCMLLLFKLAYFQVAVTLAYVLYALAYKNKEELLDSDLLVLVRLGERVRKVLPFLSGEVGLIIFLVVLLVAIILSASMVLPAFALCMTASSKGPSAVIEYLEHHHRQEWGHVEPGAHLQALVTSHHKQQQSVQPSLQGQAGPGSLHEVCIASGSLRRRFPHSEIRAASHSHVA